MGVFEKILPPERRESDRYPVHWPAIGEHRTWNDITITITNISRTGFLVTGSTGLARGERLLVRLPVVGHQDAFVVWVSGERTGFQFERPITPDDLKKMVLVMRYGAELGQKWH